MRRLLEKIIGRSKGDRNYRLDPRFSGKQLFFIAWYRGWQAFRGMWLRIRIHASGLVFCGRRVVVQHGYQIKAGKSLILEEGVHLNALSVGGIEFGNHVTIARYAVLSCTGVIRNLGTGIRIGHRSAIGAQSYLGGQGGITIGDDVIIGPQVRIFSENHNYDKTDQVIREQGESRKGVIIGNNCWIGAGVTILDGVTIGNGTVIAAGAVVTRSLPENSVAMGIPAVQMKTR